MPRRKEVSDAQIIAAARKVFLEHGVHVPVTAVAEALGVSSATVFVRMGSKKNLISAALWPPDPPVLETLRRGFERGVPAVRQLAEILEQLAAYAAVEIPATFTLYSAGLRAKPGEDFSDVAPVQLRRALAKWLREAVDLGEIQCAPQIAAELSIGTLEARAMHLFLAKREPSSRETRAFIRAMVADLFPKAIDSQALSRL